MERKKLVDTLDSYFVVDEVEDCNYKDFEVLAASIEAVVVADTVADIAVDIDYKMEAVGEEDRIEFENIAVGVPFP